MAAKNNTYVAVMNNQPEITRYYFKDILRRHRLAAGMTQEQLAGLAAISTSFLGMMETGRKWPNVDMLLRLAAALRIRPGQLVDELAAAAKSGRG